MHKNITKFDVLLLTNDAFGVNLIIQKEDKMKFGVNQYTTKDTIKEHFQKERILKSTKVCSMPKSGDNAKATAKILKGLADDLRMYACWPNKVVDETIDAIFRWCGHSMQFNVDLARDGNGFIWLMNEDVSVSKKDLKTIKKSWRIIKRDVGVYHFNDERFSLENYAKHNEKYANELSQKGVSEYIDDVVKAKDDNERFSKLAKFESRIYAGYYKKLDESVIEKEK